MEWITFEAEVRSGIGSALNRRLRREGMLPAVVYSHGEDTIPVTLNYNTFMRAAEKSRNSQIFIFKSPDKRIDGRTAVVKEVQKDGLRGDVLHVDFQALKENEAITVRITLQIKGEPVGVKMDGGILSVAQHEVAVSCLPKLIPDVIEVDVSTLKVGDTIHAKDLNLPTGVELEDDPDETIASVVLPKIVEEEKPAEVAAEGAVAAGAEGAAAAPAAGAAAPAADAGKEKGAKKE
ncbi:MAG: 50S ribosomal protein L25 [Oligoflexia bacterium]|nr:50S ribosomal protein L25 [Oligoflexia bacterium]